MTRDGAGQIPSFSFSFLKKNLKRRTELYNPNPGGLNRSPLPPNGPIDLPITPMVGGPILERGLPAVSEGVRSTRRLKMLSLSPGVSSQELRSELRATSGLPEATIAKLMKQAQKLSGVRQSTKPPFRRGFNSLDLVDGPEYDEKVALRSDMNRSGAAPIDEVGMQSRPDPTAKDPYARSVKEPGKLTPLRQELPDFDPKVVLDETVVKGHLAPYMDPRTRFIREDPEVFSVLQKLDRKKGGASRFSATLRTLRGSDPAFVKQALEQMPQARSAWEWTLAGGNEKNPSKFAKNLNWLLTTPDYGPKDPEYLLAKKAHEYSQAAFRRGDLMGADLASSAVWAIQNGQVQRARFQMEQARTWAKERPFSDNWLRTFNPRAVDRVEAEGGALVSVEGEQGLDKRLIRRKPTSERRTLSDVDVGQEDELTRITRVVPVEENRPGIAKLNFHGQPEVEEMPSVKFDGIGKKPRTGPSPDWFKVMRSNREIENELIRRGMPRELAGSTAASRWAAQKAPDLAQLHAMFQDLKAGDSGAEVLLRSSPSQATDILDLLLDEGVPPSKSEQFREGTRSWKGVLDKTRNRARGGINVNPLVDDMPHLPPMEASVGRRGVTRAIATAEQEISPMVLEWFASKMPKSLGKLAGAILRGVK